MTKNIKRLFLPVALAALTSFGCIEQSSDDQDDSSEHDKSALSFTQLKFQQNAAGNYEASLKASAPIASVELRSDSGTVLASNELSSKSSTASISITPTQLVQARMAEPQAKFQIVITSDVGTAMWPVKLDLTSVGVVLTNRDVDVESEVLFTNVGDESRVAPQISVSHTSTEANGDAYEAVRARQILRGVTYPTESQTTYLELQKDETSSRYHQKAFVVWDEQQIVKALANRDYIIVRFGLDSQAVPSVLFSLKGGISADELP